MKCHTPIYNLFYFIRIKVKLVEVYVRYCMFILSSEKRAKSAWDDVAENVIVRIWVFLPLHMFAIFYYDLFLLYLLIHFVIIYISSYFSLLIYSRMWVYPIYTSSKFVSFIYPHRSCRAVRNKLNYWMEYYDINSLMLFGPYWAKGKLA